MIHSLEENSSKTMIGLISKALMTVFKKKMKTKKATALMIQMTLKNLMVNKILSITILISLG